MSAMLPVGWKPTGLAKESGQAWVYEVRRVGGPATFALKRLKNPRRRHRFVREVETMARVRAEGLLCLPEVVAQDLDDQRPYFVMPWYRDGSLQERLETGGTAGDPALSLRLLCEVARGLDGIHAAGVAHRDIKPANVLLDGEAVVLADFGLCLEAMRTLNG